MTELRRAGHRRVLTGRSPDGQTAYAAVQTSGYPGYWNIYSFRSGVPMSDPGGGTLESHVQSNMVATRFAATPDGTVFAACTAGEGGPGCVLMRQVSSSGTVAWTTLRSWPTQGVPSLCADDTGLLFVATTDGVYAYDVRRDVWMSASEGLPNQPRSREIRFVASWEPRTKPGPLNLRRYLYLGTWGRSLWRAMY